MQNKNRDIVDEQKIESKRLDYEEENIRLMVIGLVTIAIIVTIIYILYG